MFLISYIKDFIGDTIRNRQVSHTNAARRGVVQYEPSEIGGFIEPHIFNCNVVCSGDNPELRSEMIVDICVHATNADLPVIILNQGDSTLNSFLNYKYRNHPDYYIEIGQNTIRRYDPLFGVGNDRISKIIVDAAPQKYSFACEAGLYIDVLTD